MTWPWILAGWVAVSAVTAPLIGRWLAASAKETTR
jgi:hypothetical protein